MRFVEENRGADLKDKKIKKIIIPGEPDTNITFDKL